MLLESGNCASGDEITLEGKHVIEVRSSVLVGRVLDDTCALDWHRRGKRPWHCNVFANMGDRGCANGGGQQAFRATKSLQYEYETAPWRRTHCRRFDCICDRACFSADILELMACGNR